MNGRDYRLILGISIVLSQVGCPATMPDDGDMNNGNGDTTGEAVTFRAELSGAAEVPEVSTDASGTGTFNLNETEVGFDISASGLSSPATGLHLHAAPRGDNGDIVFDLTDFLVETGEGSVGAGGAFSITPEEVAVLRAGGYYLNLHTQDNSPGEIRGQLDPLDSN